MRAQPKSAATTCRPNSRRTAAALCAVSPSPAARRSARAGGLLAGLLLGLALVSLPGTARAQLNVTAITITNTGPVRVSEALIRSNIRIKPGDPYNSAVVDEDIRNLYGTGYFQEVRVLDETTADGVHLIYALKGRPTLTEILFTGNTKFTRQKLLKKVSADFSGQPARATEGRPPPKTKMESMVGQPLDERKVFFYAQEIKKYYQKKGYQKTEVRYVVSPDDSSGRTTVTFEITEAPKYKIDEVYFEGARAFEQGKLRKVVKTRRRWMFSWITGSGVLKDEQLEDDKDRLAEFYRGKGYIDFELKEVRQLDVEPGKIALVFVVSEGRQYRVGSIGFKGVNLFSTNDILKRLKMPAGSVFTPKGLEDDLEAIRDFYGDKGYIGAGSARSIPLVPRKHANIDAGTMDLVYELEEGEQSTIEKIEIKGNVRTRDRVIRRELSVAPGEVFDMVKVKLSKHRIEGMRLFDKVDAQPEPTGIEPTKKNLVIGVEERGTGRIGFGAGFSTVDSILGFVEFAEENFDIANPPYFRGGGQKLRLRLQYGSVRQDYVLTFVEPWFFGRKLQFSTDLYYRRLDNQSLNDLYEEQLYGARFGFTKALGSDYLRGSLAYTIENVGIINVSSNASPAIRDEEGYRWVSKITPGLAYDTRRTSFNPFLPDHGQRSEVLLQYAGGPLGGETDIYGVEFRTAWYFKGFAPKHIFEVGGRIGVVDTHSGYDTVPLFDRYFLGGIDTLRGYQYREVGPQDYTGEPVGGGTYWFATAEYSIPIIEILRFAVFYDVGMVYWKSFSFDSRYQPSFGTKYFDSGFYNDNFGFGIRLNIPQFGPLRLDYGIPITSSRYNDSSGRFQFSVGWDRFY